MAAESTKAGPGHYSRRTGRPTGPTNVATDRDPAWTRSSASSSSRSTEALDQLDVELVELEQSPDSIPTLSSIFRRIHTVKGTCGFLGFQKLDEVTHVGENLLSRLRDGQLDGHTGDHQRAAGAHRRRPGDDRRDRHDRRGGTRRLHGAGGTPAELAEHGTLGEQPDADEPVEAPAETTAADEPEATAEQPTPEATQPAADADEPPSTDAEEASAAIEAETRPGRVRGRHPRLARVGQGRRAARGPRPGQQGRRRARPRHPAGRGPAPRRRDPDRARRRHGPRTSSTC